jgi:hypothetical protein
MNPGRPASSAGRPRNGRGADQSARFADHVGVVTLLKEEHENSASRIFSNDRDCCALCCK